MDNSSFREEAHKLVDWMADFLERIESYPVLPDVEPGDIISKLAQSPPENGEKMESIFSDFEKLILPGMTHWQHPSFFAYFPANSSPPSLLAEMLMSTLGAQCMSWITSPAAAELEERVMDWLIQMLGLPKEWSGVIQDTASTATLGALICAREKSANFLINERGFSDDAIGRMAVYTSGEAHSSIEKGAKIAGFGREMIRKIEVDDRYAMKPAKLREAIEKDKKDGIIPCCVVAAVGTTSSLAVDPLEEIGEICQEHNVWLHVDAAMAGTAAILPEKRFIIDGVEHADSFVFNPHKWMFTNFDCSVYFCKDPRHLIKTFIIDPEYLKTDVDLKVKNYRDWGIPLGRRFRALKLWFVIRTYGVNGLREKIRKHIMMAEDFTAWVEKHADFELLAPVDLNLVCFRYNPGAKDLTEEELGLLNKSLMDSLNRSGKMFLTHTKLSGRFTLRMSIGGTNMTEAHVAAAWDMIREHSKRLL